jgi:hypothetical protein
MKNKILYPAVLLLSIVLITFACQKNDVAKQEVPDDTETVLYKKPSNARTSPTAIIGGYGTSEQDFV